jgi:hypothetical protein
MRRRAGLMLALGYLACVTVLPVASFAAGCLADDHHVAAAAHVHDGAGGANHQDGQASDQNQADTDGDAIPANCCGMLCLNATADAVGVTIGVSPRGCPLPTALEAARSGLGPDRIDRPPSILLSL